MAQGNHRIVALQALRFVAAAGVAAAHSECATTFWRQQGCTFTYPTAVGAAGVDIFFVLSGFVIALTGPLADPRPSGADFFWRRWSRVAPLYYLLSLPLIAHALTHGWFNAPQTIATFLFWPAAGPSLVTPYIEAGWTLCFEMIFYSAVSAALVGRNIRRNLTVLAALILALFTARLFSGWPPLRILANPILAEFGLGVGLACFWPWLRRADLRIGLALVVLSIGAFAVEAVVGVGNAPLPGPTLSGDNSLWRVVAFGLPGAVLVAGGCILDRALRGPLVAAAAWLGDASYSTYLIQSVAIPVLALAALSVVGRQHPTLLAFGLFASAMGLGSLTYVLVERPIMRDLKRLRARQAARAAARRVAPLSEPDGVT
jgi:exopolysaccharide production protein ExoZ